MASSDRVLVEIRDEIKEINDRIRLMALPGAAFGIALLWLASLFLFPISQPSASLLLFVLSLSSLIVVFFVVFTLYKRR